MKDEIIINGKKYNAITGELLEAPKAVRKTIGLNDSEEIHQGLQRSNTLNRKYVSQPRRASINVGQREMISQFKRRHDYQEAILRSRQNKATQDDKLLISRFSKNSKIISPISTEKLEDQIAPFQAHPLQQKANEDLRAKKEQKTLSDREIKAAAISEAIEKSRKEHKKSRGIRRKNFFFSHRFASFSAGLAVAVLGVGYLTYLNMPNISTKIAAIQSGMDVELPSYVASGYSQKGLAYFDGKNVNFEYANNDSNYKIQQSESSWDSEALLQNYVSQKWSADYSTIYSNGLTIYSNRNGESVWVNNGRMYSVSSSSKLSSEEIRKIAVSV